MQQCDAREQGVDEEGDAGDRRDRDDDHGERERRLEAIRQVRAACHDDGHVRQGQRRHDAARPVRDDGAEIGHGAASSQGEREGADGETGGQGHREAAADVDGERQRPNQLPHPDHREQRQHHGGRQVQPRHARGVRGEPWRRPGEDGREVEEQGVGDDRHDADDTERQHEAQDREAEAGRGIRLGEREADRHERRREGKGGEEEQARARVLRPVAAHEAADHHDGEQEPHVEDQVQDGGGRLVGGGEAQGGGVRHPVSPVRDRQGVTPLDPRDPRRHPAVVVRGNAVHDDARDRRGASRPRRRACRDGDS